MLDNRIVKVTAPKRVLLSEGSSLSAREVVTALGLAGYRVGVCDPNPICLGRFSRFVTHYYRCPAVGLDPWAYLDFVIERLIKDRWDVLFPTHEQAFLFARERSRIPAGVALALAEFKSFLHVQGKAALVKTLSRLSIPQPKSLIIRTREQLEQEKAFPFYLKADYGTASTAVWRIRSTEELRARASELIHEGLLDGQQEFVVQEMAQGSLERVQSIFDRGELIAIHGYAQAKEGVGGGDIAKLSVMRPAVCRYIERLGSELNWHGALSLDYIVQKNSEVPVFIDANPRLVEPMNAVFSGVNLADILVRVSIGQSSPAKQSGAEGVRSHMLLMALLSAAGAGTRLPVIRELMRAIAGREMYANSREELLPIQTDFECLFPFLYALVRLLINPRSAVVLSGGSIAAYSLTAGAAHQIADSAENRSLP